MTSYELQESSSAEGGVKN